MAGKSVVYWRIRKKVLLADIFNSECNLCGYNKSIKVLEFHHINPEEKIFGIAANGKCRSLEKLLLEVKKCILVCSNCHREIEYGLISKETIIDSNKFSIEKWNTHFNLLKKQPQTTICNDCFKTVISKRNKTLKCQRCWQKDYHNKRPTKINWPEKGELERLVWSIPCSQLSEQLGVSDKAIEKRCKKLDILKPPRGYWNTLKATGRAGVEPAVPE